VLIPQPILYFGVNHFVSIGDDISRYVKGVPWTGILHSAQELSKDRKGSIGTERLPTPDAFVLIPREVADGG